MLHDNLKFRTPRDVSQEIFESKSNTLIIIREDWEKSFYKEGSKKIAELNTINIEKDLVLFVRVWKWTSDVFHISEEYINKFLNKS